MEELCEAGVSVITALVFVYQANTMSANSLLMHAMPLTFREEAREDTSTQSSMSQRISSSFFFFFWHIILLCLTWSLLTVSLLFVSFGSGSYSNPFPHASDMLILSLLSCCSTWQRIMLGTPFAFQVINNLCTLTNFTRTCETKQSSLLPCSQTPTCCQHLFARWPLIPPLAVIVFLPPRRAIEICLISEIHNFFWACTL